LAGFACATRGQVDASSACPSPAPEKMRKWAARRFGFEGSFNSRLGVGPIESYRNLGVEKGMAEVMAITANHFGDGFTRNWSLINRLNQKGVRPQDKPISIMELNVDEQAIVNRRYPELLVDKVETRLI
jgi:hypothetical protein